MNAQSTKQQSQHMLLQKKATLQRCNVGIMSSCFMLAHWLFWLSKNLVWLLVLQDWRLRTLSSQLHVTPVLPPTTHTSKLISHINLTHTNAQNLFQTIQNPNSQNMNSSNFIRKYHRNYSTSSTCFAHPHFLTVHLQTSHTISIWLYAFL